MKESLRNMLNSITSKFWMKLSVIVGSLFILVLLQPILIEFRVINIQHSYALDFLVVALSVVLVLRCFYWIWIDYIPSRIYTFFTFVFLIDYLVFRFLFKNVWQFTQFKSDPRYTYLDVIVTSLTFGLFLLKINELRAQITRTKKLKGGVKVSTLFKLDENESDKYQREQSATELMEYVLEIDHKHAVAIGIVGPWGAGKSWYMDKMKNYIEKLNSSENTIIKLNPWKTSSGNPISIDFFNALINKLEKKNGNVNGRVRTYIQSLANLDKSTTLDRVINGLSPMSFIDMEFEKLEDELIRTNQKIIVFIDDIDRLGNDEIFEVLKLIRNTANFRNVYFIVAYDKIHLLNALESEFKDKAVNFLDKIFHIEKSLSVIPIYSLRNEFISEILAFKDSNYLKGDYKIDASYQLIYIIDGLRGIGDVKYLLKIFEITISNKRELQKLLNSFKLKVIYLKDERIDLVQLLILDLLYLIDYKSYQKLQLKSDGIIQFDSKKVKYLFIGDIVPTSVLHPKPDDMLFFDWVLSMHSIPISQKLMKILFYDEAEIARYGRIYNPQYFNSFFEFSGGVTTAIFLRDFIEPKKVEIFSTINKYEHDGQLNELIKIIKDEGLNIIPIETEKYERFIQIVDELSIKSSESLLNKSYFDSSRLDKLYNEKDEQRWGFIKRVSNEVNNFSKYLLWEVFIQEFHLSSNPIQELMDFLSKLENDNHERLRNGDKWKKELINQIKRHNLQNRMIEYVYEFDDSKNVYSINEHYRLLFNGYEGLAEFIRQFDDSILKLEFLTFYRRFHANNYKPIEFVRGTVEITSSSETKFCGSELYHQGITDQDSAQFVHRDFQPRIEKENPEFRNVPWIAMKEEINNQEEQFNGDVYTFKRKFDVLHPELIESLTIQLYVDDVLIFLRLNGNDVLTDVETGDHQKSIITRVNDGLIVKENEIVFLVRNKSIPELGGGNRTVESVKSGENPYGIIYILELNYDFEKIMGNQKTSNSN